MASENFIGRIDTDRVLVLMKSFHRITGIPSTLLDPDGRIVRSEAGNELAVGWQRICRDFHRQNPETLKRCRESDAWIAKRLRAGEQYICYECLNGLVDAAVPVVVDGEHHLTLFTGQLFFDPPDRKRFRRQAAELGFDENGYLEALDEVPVMTRETVEQGMMFLTDLVELIGGLALGRGRLLEINRRVERELESLFKLSLDMLCVAGFDGYFRHLNPAWERTLGWTGEELRDRPWMEFVHPDDRERTLEAGRILSEGREIISFENRYHCKDGSYRWLSWNSRPLFEQGLIYAAVRDVTAAKEAEEALRERDRLQGALETAGAACHELNQPLQAITGFADLLLLEVMDQEGPSEKARRIQQAVRLIGSITRKLSGITRYRTMDYFQGKIVDIDRSRDPATKDNAP